MKTFVSVLSVCLGLQTLAVFAELMSPDEVAKMVRDIKKNGTQLFRAYDKAKINHRYYLSNKTRQDELNKVKTMITAGDIGFVVSDAFYKDHVQPQCKLAMAKMNVYYHKASRRTEMVSTSLPAKTHTKVGSFWCAVRDNYCGANFAIRYLTRITCLNQWKDYFYPANQVEHDDWLASEQYGKTYQYTGCYIWN